QVLAAAELVLSRSGAGTVWESAVLGKPMVLLPLRGSGTRGDQVENAEFFEKAGAAAVLRPRPGSGEVTARDLAALIRDLAEDPERLAALSAAAARIGQTDGAAVIAGAIEGALPGETRSHEGPGENFSPEGGAPWAP
ncbi:MAG: hypothetical protein LBU19_04735, partial [Treponema sp.]|nr:hypothetical protein [Treponema sp.]